MQTAGCRDLAENDDVAGGASIANTADAVVSGAQPAGKA
jgi:hypothetical protein